MVEEMISLANKGELMGNYRTEETNHLINGLKMANGVKNGRVLVIGSESPWVEAAVLSVGAREVVTRIWEDRIGTSFNQDDDSRRV